MLPDFYSYESSRAGIPAGSLYQTVVMNLGSDNVASTWSLVLPRFHASVRLVPVPTGFWSCIICITSIIVYNIRKYNYPRRYGTLTMGGSCAVGVVGVEFTGIVVGGGVMLSPFPGPFAGPFLSLPLPLPPLFPLPPDEQ